MKKYFLLLFTTFLIKIVFAQSLPWVIPGPYSKCDSCFTFTAYPDTMHPGPYIYHWTFKGPNGSIYAGKIINHCDASVTAADTLLLIIKGSDSVPQYYGNTLSYMLPNLGANNTYQSICIVSVDTSVNKNLIVWDQTADTTITSYNLYKETSTSGVYALLANIPRKSFSTYTDTVSAPDTKSARYRLTTVDTCGYESNSGSAHKTMHLTVSSGIPPAWNLIWENYSGLSFLKYRIWRKSASGWQLIDSVSTSSTTYTDVNPPSGFLRYVIEVVSPNVCTPSLKLPSINSTYSNSLSNMDDNGLSGMDEYSSSITIEIFPNPFSAEAILQILDPKFQASDLEMEIYDVTGRIMIHESVPVTSKQIIIRRNNLESGLYFLVLKDKNQLISQAKIIVRD